jgi:hypothetical protein
VRYDTKRYARGALACELNGHFVMAQELWCLMLIRTANRLIQTIGMYTRGPFGLRKWLFEKRSCRAVSKRERELEREIRKNGLSTLLEPHWADVQAPHHRED